MALEDMGQNPPIQLISNLSQEPLWTCNEIIQINLFLLHCSKMSMCQASLTFALQRSMSLAALKIAGVCVHRALDERLEVGRG